MKISKLLAGALAFSVLTAGCANKTASATSTPSSASTAASQSTASASSSAANTPSASPAAEADDAEAKAKEYLAKMDLTSKIEQMMVPAVKKWNGENFTAMNDEVAAILSNYHFGGIILFAESMTSDSAQAINLTQSMQINTVNGGGAPLFMGTDQECGNV